MKCQFFWVVIVILLLGKIFGELIIRILNTGIEKFNSAFADYTFGESYFYFMLFFMTVVYSRLTYKKNALKDLNYEIIERKKIFNIKVFSVNRLKIKLLYHFVLYNIYYLELTIFGLIINKVEYADISIKKGNEDEGEQLLITHRSYWWVYILFVFVLLLVGIILREVIRLYQN